MTRIKGNLISLYSHMVFFQNIIEIGVSLSDSEEHVAYLKTFEGCDHVIQKDGVIVPSSGKISMNNKKRRSRK